ncbi:cyclophilin-like domain-containing protein [Kockovaella imperatae]|uniref:peptidylprolyl isomerase n=1 Tax=Kockovaella imperatae TaxID=4999 RepID=A0A1Y1UNS3_9TREE|nr:cyclophilin-like domain-containing protein [Kockovaella imperatae]ORX39187.1 cyclophilin-like domain-containing protein [Kockovaella imperatae]
MTDYCYFDITIAGQPAGRITFELYSAYLPKTTENFKALCIGDKTNDAGVKLAYAGSSFHRCIKGFMLQAGDFTRGDGTGGLSIYGEKFSLTCPDEAFIHEHDKPMLLSMANAGPNTNGSQFFITTVPTPHLDGKHVVFGQVVTGKALVRRIENIPTTSDKPNEPVTIAAAGVLSKEDIEAERKKIQDSKGEDPYEEYPVDEESINVDKPEECATAAEKLKEVGTTAFKAGDFAKALGKYQKALRYLDQNPVLPDGTDKAVAETQRKLRIPLLTNSALAALKSDPPANSLAVTLASKALAVSDLTPEEKGKALYRRALAKTALKDEDGATKDLKEALEAVPGDANISRALKNVEVAKKARLEKERKAYSKMFA